MVLDLPFDADGRCPTNNKSPLSIFTYHRIVVFARYDAGRDRLGT